ncbi:MAG: ribonuclease P protein component [Zetaproteobacteria bacterium]|nr:MAG: ribonuclease P protein component [Zetaproteobacteria bacterium]
MHTRKEELAAIEMLTARSDFLIVQNKGKKWVSHGLILQIRKNELGHIRTGYTVTKKIDKSAVKRNRIKRRLRSISAEILSHYALDGHDYILVGRQLTATRSYDMLVDDLKWCLRRSGFAKSQEK